MSILKLLKIQKFIQGVLLGAVFITLVYAFKINTIASHCDLSNYDCQIEEIAREIDALTPAHENNKNQLDNLKIQIASIKERISNISFQLSGLETDIEERESELDFAWDVVEEKTDIHYRLLRLYDPISPFLYGDSASQAFMEIAFKSKAINDNQQTVDKYIDDLIQLKNDRDELEKNKTSLASANTNLSSQANFLTGEIKKVESYLTELSSKQQELAALKAGGFSTSIGDTPPTYIPCSGPPGSSYFCNPGFSPAFAVFSFGAPHRTGMSQYGAYGRSKSGQTVEQILSAYYQGATLEKSYAVPATINVSGYGAISFEENYLLGIHEVPESWGDNGGLEALKAQAIAARSYALYATNGGSGTICPTESCQVYKPSLKSGKWKEAVQATRGWVLTKGGSPAAAYYSSTTGGYTISQWGWTGIKDASGAWPDTAYEKIGGSPWFYMGWYKDRSGAACGRTHPWLTSSEMADILNARYVLDGKGGDAGRISPVDTSCWGGNPYSVSELSGIGGYTSVSGVNVVYGNDGSTLNVSFSTNKGNINVSGGDFKEAFNLRAPGYIGAKSSLFNIEKI